MREPLTLNRLAPLTRRKRRKRLGRGDASGHGGTSTRGHKGQKARAGGFHKRGFEGGQMPLLRRLPKRGFTNVFRKEVGAVNVGRLAAWPADTEVTLTQLQEKGWVAKRCSHLKILGEGELSQPLTIQAHAVSKTAAEKIKKAGGRLTLIG